MSILCFCSCPCEREASVRQKHPRTLHEPSEITHATQTLKRVAAFSIFIHSFTVSV
ncbi:hypothetical protein M9458_041091, partial [Cirrhinus mrigala]